MEDFEIEVPTHKPNGDPIKTVGIWMSGGADSSFVCYAVCKYIKENNLPIRVQPLTVRRSKPGNPFHAVPVSLKIRELLNIDFMNPHIVYYPPIETEEERYIADGPVFRDMNRVNFSSGIVDLLFSGMTMNPPQNVQLTFKDGISKEEHIRGEEVKKRFEMFDIDGGGVVHYQIDPICHINKRDLALLYEQEGITDTIFPITRSCAAAHWEKDGTPNHPSEGHCGKCWWCEERLWGFERLE